MTFGGPHDDEASARPSAHTQHGAADKHDKQDGHEEGESAQQPVAAFPSIRFPGENAQAENAHHIKRSQQQPAPHLQQTGFNAVSMRPRAVRAAAFPGSACCRPHAPLAPLRAPERHWTRRTA